MFRLCLTPAQKLTLSSYYANLVKVKSVQATLDKAWKNFAENDRSLLDEDSIEIHEVDGKYVSQETRKLQYDLKIEEYTVLAATHFNEQISQDFANIGTVSPARSLRSASSRVSSRLSEASARLRDTRTAAAKAALAAKQTEQKRKRSIEIAVKRLEMEMNQKQLELEMAKLEAEKDVAEAKERTEVAKLEAELAENEYSELMLNANSSSHHSRFPPGLAFGNTSHTSSLTTPPTSAQVYTFPVINTQAHTTSSASARVYTHPAKNTQVDTLSPFPRKLTRFRLCPRELIHFQLRPRKLPRFQPCSSFHACPRKLTRVQQYQPRSPRFQPICRMLLWPKLRPRKFPWFHPPLCKFLHC